MTVGRAVQWHRLGVNGNELILSRTLPVGQSFAWRKVAQVSLPAPALAKNQSESLTPASSGRVRVEDTAVTWRGVIGRRAIELQQTDDGDVWYRFGREAGKRQKGKKENKDKTLEHAIHTPTATPSSALSPCKDDDDVSSVHALLHSYFRLDVDYVKLHSHFIGCDTTGRYRKLAPYTIGCRVLEQDPIECLFSFICSSNNNIARIHKMVDFLREKYGDEIEDVPWRRCEKIQTSKMSVNTSINSKSKDSNGLRKSSNGEAKINGDLHNDRVLHTFPTLKQLSHATEEELRANGFGYRAKFIVDTATMLTTLSGEKSLENGGEKGHENENKSEDWLLDLRHCQDRKHVLSSLEQLPGIGPKVARCIALFCLSTDDSIPVDTHVWQITKKYYSSYLVDEIRGASMQAQAKQKNDSTAKEELLLASMPKTLTPKVMEHIENVFTKIFGEYSVRF